VPVQKELRPGVPKTTPSAAVRVLDLNRGQAIVDTTGKVKVVPGDSLWKLAERYFGSGLRWKRLAALNPQLADPNRLRVGDWIQTPSERKQTAKHVIIQPGDTLWRVARAELGSPLALNCLAQANPQLRSVDLVLAGETLVVPATCADLDKTQN
jgi:nucleoid-associated protein YgaU